MFKPIFSLILLLALFIVPFHGKAQFKVLFVNDNGVYQSNTDTVMNALNHTGYSYDIFNARDSLRSPTTAEMSGYKLVIWYCSTDGVGNYFWNGTNTDNTDLIAYLQSGGSVWVMGNDFMYDRYTTPSNFSAGDFVSDYLGIRQYFAQSYADDGGVGVSELDLAYPGFSSLQKIHWIYATAWWIDACLPIGGAGEVYIMGPESYVLHGYSSAIWYAAPGHTTLSFFFDPALMDTYANRLALFGDVLRNFELITGSRSPGELPDLSIFPNPSREYIRITLPVSFRNKAVSLQLRDCCGRLVLENRFTWDGNETYKVGIKQLPSGLYTILACSGNEMIRGKVIVAD